MRASFVHFALWLTVWPFLVAGCGSGSSSQITLLNVSYDPTRELWKDLNEAFLADPAQTQGQPIVIKQSHGASGSQARAVMEGLDADVISLALWPDTHAVEKSGLVQPGWMDELPNRSLPYTSTIVFVVRKGNPRQVKDWSDLVQPGIQVITPNPKTSGNGKLALMAAWGSVIQSGGTEEEARAFLQKLYQSVPVLDTGARGSTTTFAQKGIGDVHLTWESEAHLEVREAEGTLEIVYPPVSILAEPHVTLVDSNVDRRGTRKIAQAYLDFLYTPTAQEVIAKHYYRPASEDIRERHRADFPDIRLFPVTDIVPDWDAAQQRFFDSGALFDQIYSSSR